MIGSIKCATCEKKLENEDFKIKSLFMSDKYVCYDCATKEDEEWMKNPMTAEEYNKMKENQKKDENK